MQHSTYFQELARNVFVISVALFLLHIVLTSCNNTKEIEIDEMLIDRNEDLRLRGKIDSIIKINSEYIKRSKKRKYRRGEALGYINIANIYATIGKYNESVKLLDKANVLIYRASDDYLKMRLFHEYGQVNFVMGLREVALKYNQKAIFHSKKVSLTNENRRTISNIYTVRADFIKHKYSDSTLYYFKKGAEIDNSELNYALIGNYYSVEIKNKDSAQFYLNKSMLMLKNIVPYWNVRRGVIYTFYGNYLYYENRLEEALSYYQKAANVLSETNRINKLPLIYEDIIQISQTLGDRKLELEYRAKYKTINDSLISSTIKATDLALNHAIQEVDRIKYDRDRETTLYLLALCVVVLIFIWIMYKRGKRQKHIVQTIIDSTNDAKMAELRGIAMANDSSFLSKLNDYYPDFSKRLYDINPNISDSNVVFCAYIWLGFSSKEIAQYTFVQHRSIQTQKSRIRKKLDIDSEIDLYSYFRNL